MPAIKTTVEIIGLSYKGENYYLGDDVGHIEDKIDGEVFSVWCGHFSPDGINECSKTCKGCQYENVRTLDIL